MDGRRFDEMTKALADGLSRRRLLRALGAGAAGGLLGWRGVEADNACKPAAPAASSKCTKDGQCCAGLVCEGGLCRPGCRVGGQYFAPDQPDPTTPCRQCRPASGTAAFSPTPAGVPCGPGPSCADGIATAQATCDGAGGCPPGPTSACAPYLCGATACTTDCASDDGCAGAAYCDTAAAPGVCREDLANGQACLRGAQCLNGSCVAGVCCDSACPPPANATATCPGGACGFACAAGYHTCDGATCVSDGDVATCGAACIPCPTPANGTAACDGTSCGVACAAGYHTCDGASCVSDASPDSCGPVGCAPCPSGPADSTRTCTGGVCGFACNEGFEACGGGCIPADGCCSDADCDTCGCEGCDPASHTCVSRCDAALGQDCAGGVCQSFCAPGQSFCDRSGDPCEGDGCRCAADGRECVEIVLDTGPKACCCDATECVCVTNVVLCCESNQTCVAGTPFCCESGGPCLHKPIQIVPR